MTFNAAISNCHATDSFISKGLTFGFDFSRHDSNINSSQKSEIFEHDSIDFCSAASHNNKNQDELFYISLRD